MLEINVTIDENNNLVCYSLRDLSNQNYIGTHHKAIQDVPMDLSKWGGYKVVSEADGYHLVFDEEKYQAYLKEQERQASVDMANEKYEELAYEVVLSTASDEDAYTMRYLYPTWEVGIEYKKDNRIMYEDKFYKVLQDHTSQADWLPTTAVSLYVEIADPSVEYPQWKQPTSSENAYMKGDKVTYNEVKYVSLVDNNVWSPSDYPQGWEEVE